MSRFDSGLYRRYRIQYPAGLFMPLRPLLGALVRSRLRVLDLGAGTGNSAFSFQTFYQGAVEFTLIDPDPAMLEASEEGAFPEQTVLRRIAAPSEGWASHPGAPREADLALIGSAWHWMKAGPTIEVLSRAIIRGGGVFIFEYQFPKAVEHSPASGLNEWIRREFNLRWRDPAQVPRGSLRELTAGFRDHAGFCEESRVSCRERVRLSPEELSGVIQSQSRYLAFERGLPDEAARSSARQDLMNGLRARWSGEEPIPFEYEFEGFLFRRRFD